MAVRRMQRQLTVVVVVEVSAGWVLVERFGRKREKEKRKKREKNEREIESV